MTQPSQPISDFVSERIDRFLRNDDIIRRYAGIGISDMLLQLLEKDMNRDWQYLADQTKFLKVSPEIAVMVLHDKKGNKKVNIVLVRDAETNLLSIYIGVLKGSAKGTYTFRENLTVHPEITDICGTLPCVEKELLPGLDGYLYAFAKGVQERRNDIIIKQPIMDAVHRALEI